MRPLFRSMLGLCILSTWAPPAPGQGPEEEPVYRLKPALPGAKPIEVKERQTGWYSAVSKLENTDTRDGIGVRWNWPKELGEKRWGAKGTISLVAFPEEAVAYGKHRGMALRLINRSKEPVHLDGCDSGLPIVQEAQDEHGRWREIENTRSSWCGNSYHKLALGSNEYWEFAAPVYTGGIKAKIRFRLDASGPGTWVYSNEFDGFVSKAQLRLGPGAVEIRKAFNAKDAKEGVVATLVELLTEDEKDSRRSHLSQLAVERLAELGPAAKEAATALRKMRDEKTGELQAITAYALWRIDGDTAACVKALVSLLKARDDDYVSSQAAGYLWHMGPAAEDAIPALCWAIENGKGRTRGVAVGALGTIRVRPDIAVPALVKALTREDDLAGAAIKALGEFGTEAKVAVPTLLDYAKRAEDPNRVEVAFALWQIQAKAEPAVTILIEEMRSSRAYHAANRLGEIGPSAKAAVPELTRSLKNDDYGLIAAHALWKITRRPEPTLSTAVRALEEKGYRQPRTAISILEDMGEQAMLAVPALLEVHRVARKTGHDALQEEVEKALRKIDPAAAEKASIR